jgi:Domain of unknown function (DUF4349)
MRSRFGSPSVLRVGSRLAARRQLASVRVPLGLLLAAAIAVAVAACGSPSPGRDVSAGLASNSGGGNPGLASAPAATTAPAAAGEAAQPLAARVAALATHGSVSDSAAAPAQAPADQAAPPPLSADRMVIRTAQLSIQVGDMESALASVRKIADQGGGFVSTSSTRIERVNDQDRTVADLTIQVRSSIVDETLSALRALGKVTAETSGSQDVTEEYVDLDSNLRNLQASESAILKLMDKATRIEDVLSLQRELTTVRGQIERIQGRKRFLERRTDMATISVSLRLPAPESDARPTSPAWDPLGIAQRGWQASLTVLRAAAEVMIVVAAFSWWLLPVIAVGLYVWQRRRARPVAPPAPPVVAP